MTPDVSHDVIPPLTLPPPGPLGQTIVHVARSVADGELTKWAESWLDAGELEDPESAALARAVPSAGCPTNRYDVIVEAIRRRVSADDLAKYHKAIK